jgi:hypothetical protein
MLSFVLVILVAVATGAVVADNISLATSGVSNSAISLKKSEALSTEFTFNGIIWNDTEIHGVSGTWRPFMEECKATYGASSNDGHLVNCKNGNGNCSSTTLCIKDL